MKTIRWGIVGCGGIAAAFAEALTVVEGAELVAVGSRSLEKAREFAARYGAKNAHGSYESLAADPEVDAVYVATIHPLHARNALSAIENGKAVLCEKPFTMTAAELEPVIQRAREKQVFMMEAMWTRFQPAATQVRRWIAEGKIGDPRVCAIDFCFKGSPDPASRLLNKEIGGGAVLDVGIYVTSYACMAFGATPEKVHSLAQVGSTGVDEQTAMIYRFPGGKLASLTCGTQVRSIHEARIFGSEGMIVVPDFWHATRATLVRGEQQETCEAPFIKNGYEYEIMEVCDCLRAGKLESSIMPLDESLAIMRVLDEVQANW